MSTIYGTVVKATSSMASGTTAGETKPFLARRADGTFIGAFNSLREAQKPIELCAGGVLLRWIDESRHGIEAYRGETP